MPETQNQTVMKWLFSFSFVVVFLIVFGGFVRLTRSGLSIVEWNPVSGVIPPVGQQAWETEFAKYQRSPEYLQINTSMTLEEYKYIFYIEWIHRLIARLAGLAYAIPAFYFLFKKAIPWKEFGVYVVMGLLFISQAFAGWIMVASGLVDRPSVSHFNLTVHLLLALTLLGLSLWTALGHKHGFSDRSKKVKWSLPSKWALAYFVVLIIQITYGGFTAGLKAGHVSSTWPLMFGKWIPPNLFNSFVNIFESPQTIVFIHRWLAWLVLIVAGVMYWNARKQGYYGEVRNGITLLVAAVAVQILLGIFTVLSFVNIVIALLHQATGILLFAIGVYFLHRFRALDRAG
jgi:cytochrome c oxidase assembly protein subunit 15